MNLLREVAEKERWVGLKKGIPQAFRCGHCAKKLQVYSSGSKSRAWKEGIENKSDNLDDNLQLITDDRHKQITLLELKIKRLEAELDKLSKANAEFIA